MLSHWQACVSRSVPSEDRFCQCDYCFPQRTEGMEDQPIEQKIGRAGVFNPYRRVQAKTIENGNVSETLALDAVCDILVVDHLEPAGLGAHLSGRESLRELRVWCSPDCLRTLSPLDKRRKRIALIDSGVEPAVAKGDAMGEVQHRSIRQTFTLGADPLQEVAGDGVVIVQSRGQNPLRSLLEALCYIFCSKSGVERSDEDWLKGHFRLCGEDPFAKLLRCLLVKIDQPMKIAIFLSSHAGQAIGCEQFEATRQPAGGIANWRFPAWAGNVESGENEVLQNLTLQVTKVVPDT